LSAEAQAEARLLMLAAQNILNPKDGKPVVTPSQDMVLGNYYLTLEREGARGEGSVFNDSNEVLIAYQNGHVHLHSRIAIKASSLNNPTFTEEQNKMFLLSTVGKVIFNEILPRSFPYINEQTSVNLEQKTPEKYFVNLTIAEELLEEFEATAGYTDLSASENVEAQRRAILAKHFPRMPVVDPSRKIFLRHVTAQVFEEVHMTDSS